MVFALHGSIVIVSLIAGTCDGKDTVLQLLAIEEERRRMIKH